jgi:hypothetical protein
MSGISGGEVSFDLLERGDGGSWHLLEELFFWYSGKREVECWSVQVEPATSLLDD